MNPDPENYISVKFPFLSWNTQIFSSYTQQSWNYMLIKLAMLG